MGKGTNGILDGRAPIKTPCCIKCWNRAGLRASWAASINTTEINGVLAGWSQRAAWSSSRGFQAFVNKEHSICSWTYLLFSHLWYKWLHTSHPCAGVKNLLCFLLWIGIVELHFPLPNLCCHCWHPFLISAFFSAHDSPVFFIVSPFLLPFQYFSPSHWPCCHRIAKQSQNKIK